MVISSDTIAAIATPLGKGGVGIIRISGERVKLIIQKLIQQELKPRYAHYLNFYNHLGEVIDQGIAIYYPAPHSLTGEEVLELQGHGGLIILENLLQEVLSIGARLAEPGEFLKRAFLNHKIDLAQAEAIADLIDASSKQAAKSALVSMQGEFSKQINKIVSQLINLRVEIEARIDFDEEINNLSYEEIKKKWEELNFNLTQILDIAKQGSVLREGIHVVIAGKPNVGKSSLLNALSGQDSAIVTEIPGTTRDILREYIQIDGMPLHVIDTAGLRESEDIIEQEGIKRARKAIEKADLILWVIDAPPNEAEIATVRQLSQEASSQKLVAIIYNKIDLIHQFPALIYNNREINNNREISGGDKTVFRPDGEFPLNREISGGDKTVFRPDGEFPLIYLSAKYHQGIELLKQYLKDFMGYNSCSEGVFMARKRHLDAISRAKSALDRGRPLLLSSSPSLELLAAELFEAQQALSLITGAFTPDDLLDQIFKTFCLGK